MATKKFAQMSNKRLHEIMLEKYPCIDYTAEQSDEFLKNLSEDLENESEDVIAYNFKEYVNRAEKFIVIKTVGKYDNFIVREFDDEESAQLFVALMRNSEQCDFIRYRITKVINY